MRTPDIGAAIGRNWKGVWELMKRLGIPRQPHNRFPTNSDNPSWKGGRYVDRDGYVCIHFPSHPNARGKGYVREHRLVMERSIGRYLTAKEVVHHRNGKKDDNRIENLRLFGQNADHLRHELAGRIPKWTEDGKRRIAEGVRRSKGNQLASSRKA